MKPNHQNHSTHQKMTDSLSVVLTCVLVFISSVSSKVEAKKNNHHACEIKSLSSPEVKGRGSQLMFPDGRTITVVGHIHGDRQIYEMIHDLEQDTHYFEKLSDVEFENYFRKILVQNQKPEDGYLITREDYLNKKKHINVKFGATHSSLLDESLGFNFRDKSPLGHAQQDQALIQKLVQNQEQDHRPHFIGWEATFEHFKNYYMDFQELKRKLYLEFLIRKQSGHLKLSESDFRKALLSSMNANTFAYINDPSLMRKMPLISVENEQVTHENKQVNSLKAFESAYEDLIKTDSNYWSQRKPHEHKKWIRNPRVIHFWLQLEILINDIIAMNIDTQEKLEKRFEIVKRDSAIAPWLQSALDSVLEKARLRVKYNLLRNYHMAENLVSMGYSGTHFVGLNHFRDILHQLQKLCLKEQVTEQEALRKTPNASTEQGELSSQ